MKPIDIFNAFNFEDAKKARKNAKIIYKIFKYGSKGFKGNPALVYIDAVISVGEAIIAFYNYQQAKEITKQLQDQLEILKNGYKNKEIEFKLMEKKLNLNLKSKIDLKIKEEENIREQWIKIYKPIYENSLKYLIILKNRLENIRLEYPNSDNIKQIEIKYSEAIEAHVNATLFIIGG